jgi:thiosulfate/3-mercaptopyruvate sulfurtransferase
MKTLIDAATVSTQMHGGAPLVLLDCGFDLANPGAGEAAWRQGHLPGAHYLHLERDLSGSLSRARQDPRGVFRGRHPLPDRAAWAATLGRAGIASHTPVVCYDDQGGPYAARAWWLLRWMGHDDVAVLDGGKGAWIAGGGALSTGDAPARPAEAPYPLRDPAMPTIEAPALLAQLGTLRLIDARAPERFRGEVEPLDAAAGHIPGARNRCFKDNLQADGRFALPQTLRAAFEPLVAGGAVHYCGSGVTACHNLLAAAHAGLGVGTLYPGSWSEWSSDARRPQAQGA